MRFGAILSVLSLGLLAIAAPTPTLQDVAVARSAPVDLVVRDIASPAVSFDKGVGDLVAARAAADDFMTQLNNINNNLETIAAPFIDVKVVVTAEVLATVQAQINVLVGLFINVGIFLQIDINVVAAIFASISINVAVILSAAVKAGLKVDVVVQAFIALLGHIGSASAPLANSIYAIISVSVFVQLFVGLGINVVALLSVAVGVSV
ncbi:hypothetical protein BOTBODRAFT_452102 [Botryobasidium botryosum FD-172 SS1]|uniref:Uncharacterized protein n=1 Tax=Botryobasidium botryosum (strain FD-172 SS1) TaxID=930990 RepID=A0A067MIZ5_BOTB1|nr:hypothetical protein BOTBODRAFT_452102 [Botryobasidium botryosum FD-172 SS1]